MYDELGGNKNENINKFYNEADQSISPDKKLLIPGIIAIAVVLLLILWNYLSPAKEPEGDITAFHYNYGSYFGGYYSYELERRYDGKVSFTATGGNGVDLNIYAYVDPVCLDELADIINECIIYTWNGFDQRDDSLMDGYSFTLEAKYSDDRIITAHGYEKEPVNYSAAHQALTEFFQKMCEKYDVAQENNGLMGNIDFVIYAYRTPEHGKRTYSLSKNDKETVNFEVSGDVLSRKKTLDISVIQKLEDLIIEKEIYKWNGFDEGEYFGGEDRGFYLMVNYENIRQINASGSGNYPESYELGHQALVEFFDSITE